MSKECTNAEFLQLGGFKVNQEVQVEGMLSNNILAIGRLCNIDNTGFSVMNKNGKIMRFYDSWIENISLSEAYFITIEYKFRIESTCLEDYFNLKTNENESILMSGSLKEIKAYLRCLII